MSETKSWCIKCGQNENAQEVIDKLQAEIDRLKKVLKDSKELPIIQHGMDLEKENKTLTAQLDASHDDFLRISECMRRLEEQIEKLTRCTCVSEREKYHIPMCQGCKNAQRLEEGE